MGAGAQRWWRRVDVWEPLARACDEWFAQWSVGAATRRGSLRWVIAATRSRYPYPSASFDPSDLDQLPLSHQVACHPGDYQLAIAAAHRHPVLDEHTVAVEVALFAIAAAFSNWPDNWGHVEHGSAWHPHTWFPLDVAVPVPGLGSLRGAPATLFGTGAPTAIAPVGSMYLRTDGDTRTSVLYVKGAVDWKPLISDAIADDFMVCTCGVTKREYDDAAAIHRGADGVLYVNINARFLDATERRRNRITRSDDQEIDFEPTSGPGPSDYRIYQNALIRRDVQ